MSRPAPPLRSANLARLADQTFDVLVLGGGINGAVSAACLAGRGASVGLIDRGDFASFTSQQSSNLAWGGIKYMESLELGLVRKLCNSRNHLIRSYPSTVQEIRFLTVHETGFRHGLWMLVLGAWLYWVIGSLFTKVPRWLRPSAIAEEEPIIDVSRSDGGFEYSDAYLHDNDARFVWNFVRSALDHGCAAGNYVEAERFARGDDGIWVTRARDAVTGAHFNIRSRVLVNACGPLVDAVNAGSGQPTAHRHVLSKGVHLIVDRLSRSRRVLTFFADDGRPFFVIPMGTRSCIGTTDTPEKTPTPHVTEEDRRFVLDNINKRLRLSAKLTTRDIIAERCGVRPLAVLAGNGAGTNGKAAPADWMQLSRKHVVEVDRERRHISIFGGKLTDCLNVGAEVADAIASFGVVMPRSDARWYGEAPEEIHEQYLQEAAAMDLDGMTSPLSSEKLTTRLWRRYGAEALELLREIRSDPRMAEVLIENAEYLRAEIALAARREMIVKLEDFLRRRSKIALVVRGDVLSQAPGLRDACRLLFGDLADARFEEYFATHPPGGPGVSPR